MDRALDSAEQRPRPLTRDEPERPVDHTGHVLIPGIARLGNGIPPVASRPGSGSQPDQLRRLELSAADAADKVLALDSWVWDAGDATG
jgi:hypothetical protein